MQKKYSKKEQCNYFTSFLTILAFTVEKINYRFLYVKIKFTDKTLVESYTIFTVMGADCVGTLGLGHLLNEFRGC
jgi:hypothetical protein